MKHLFIPYELAVIAKEKGFNEGSVGGYNSNKEPFMAMVGFGDNKTTNNDLVILGSSNITAPLYQQIIDWFREEHKIIIEIQLDQTFGIKWAYDIIKYNDAGDFERKTDISEWGLYRKYYKALNSSIEEAFKLI